eukprot:1721027-Rhodomonas_salina.1
MISVPWWWDEDDWCERWAVRVMSSAGVRAASARRNARGDGLCMARMIGASSAESVAAAAEAAS